MPGVRYPGSEGIAAPVTRALADAVGSEEKLRPGTWQLAPTRARIGACSEVLPMGHTHSHAVNQLVAIVRVDRAAHLPVTGDVDEGSGDPLKRVNRIIGNRLLVAPQPLDEFDAARRGEPDELDPVPPRQQKCSGERRLARSAGDEERPAGRPPPVTTLGIGTERSGEE